MSTYDDIVDDLLARNADVEATKMMGMPSLKANGKLFAGRPANEDAMAFKLGGDDHAQALALKGAHLFDPSGRGRPMKEWIVVPAAHAARWPELAEAALRFVMPAG